MTQQACHLSWQLQDGAITARYLIHDRDSKFPPGFDAVYQSEGTPIIRTPYRGFRWVVMSSGELRPINRGRSTGTCQ